MVRNGLLAIPLLILLLAGGFSFSVASHRALAAEDGNQKPQHKVSPLPTPVPLPKSDPVPLPSPPPPPPPNAEQLPKDAVNPNGKDSPKGPSESDNSVFVPPPTPASEPPPLLASKPPPPLALEPPPQLASEPPPSQASDPPPPQASDPPPPPPSPQALPPPLPAVVPPPPVSVPPPPFLGPQPLPDSVKEKSPQKDGAKKPNPNSGEPGSDMDTKQDAACAGSTDICRVSDFVACLQRSDDSKELFLIVQNGGDDALNVNIRTSIPIDLNTLQVPKHSTEKVSVSSNATEVIQVVLNNGKGDCILQIRPSVSDWNPFQQFPAYASQLTPIHGAYFLFVAVVIAGGTWACCKFGRKARRGSDGIAYQQLEMGSIERASSAVAHANSTDGWDQNWDSDWDEEDAIGRTSEIQPAEDTINGHTSKPSNKGEWDDDWDD